MLELATLLYLALLLCFSEFSLRKCWLFPCQKINENEVNSLSKCSTTRKKPSHNNNKAFVQKHWTTTERRGFSSAFQVLWYQVCCCKTTSALKIINLLMFQLTQSRVNYANETPGYMKKPFHHVHTENLCSFEFLHNMLVLTFHQLLNQLGWLLLLPGHGGAVKSDWAVRAEAVSSSRCEDRTLVSSMLSRPFGSTCWLLWRAMSISDRVMSKKRGLG